MSISSSTNQPTKDSATAFVWGQYRVYAVTSRAYKAELSAWRFRVLALSIGGAFLATVCQQSSGWGLEGGRLDWLPTVLGVLSAIALGLAAYFGKEILNPDKERRWIRARSMAESLKAEAYLFLAGAAPYGKAEAIDIVFKRTEELLDTAKDLPTKTISEEDKRKGLPPGALSVEQYIEVRLNDQINKFYLPKAIENERIMKRGRQISLFLGALAVVLGALGTSGWTAAWVAVITTITVAIAAYLYAGRYQYLVISYQATARRLELLRSRWLASGMTDANADERNQFIRNCEEAISVENNAWMAKFTKETT